MSGKNTSFEVQVLKEKRWVLAEVAGDEASALQFADNLAGKSNYDAVRVVRDFRRADGVHSETVLREQTTSGKKPEITLASLPDAPLCTELGQAYALPARLVIGRLFRRYLDEVVLTPTELLHSVRELKRLTDKGNLLMSAVDQVAALQAPAGGDEARQRRDFLHRSWEQLVDRARRAAPDKPPVGQSLAALVAAAGKAAEPPYQALVLMSAQLLEQRGWMAKLDMVLGWMAEDGAAAQRGPLDGLIADLLMSGEAVQDLLGVQVNLGAALCQICDLVEGKAQPAKFASESFAALNRLFGEGHLPQAREALLGRVMRELRGSNPLSRNQPDQEFEAFVKLLNRLVSFHGVTAGAAMAAALTQRSSRFRTSGGTAGMLVAIDEISECLSDRCRTSVYLVNLSDSTAATDPIAAPLQRRIGALTTPPQHIDQWVPARLPARDRMVALTQCHGIIAGTSGLPQPLKSELANCCDSVLAQYLADDQVIEKIDKPEDALALRALRLVKFCCSGVLIKGRSLNLAHQRVLGYLRQPHFEEKFLTSIPNRGQAEQYLREFHRLLVQSGFNS